MREPGRVHVLDCTPLDLGATIHHAVGITMEQKVSLGLSAEGKVITELF